MGAPLFIVICFLSLQPIFTFSKICHPEEQQSLIDFRKAIQIDTTTVFESWNVTAFPNCCDWNGIVCDDIGRVTELSIQSNPDTVSQFMKGRLSYSLFNLEWLQILSITGMKQLYGGIPSLKKLKNLKVLELENNRLGGELPTELPLRLAFISLSGNIFYGMIPYSFFAKSLTSINLAKNFLTGQIPNSIANLQKIQTLDLSFNLFTGSIPNSFSNLTKLEYLDLSYNGFSGEFPLSIFDATNLKTLVIDNNRVTGILSEEIGNLSKLNILSLACNNFWGKIPKSIAKLNVLWNLNIRSNHFRGELPSEFENGIRSISSFDISHNDLSLKIFPNWLTKRKLSLLAIAGYGIPGRLPVLSQTEYLAVIDLSSNKFTSGLFEFFVPLPLLSSVNLSNNLLSEDLTNLKLPIQISKLDLHNNFLSGSLLQFFNNTKIQFMEIIDLSENHFSGAIPSFEDAVYLKLFNISANSISGHIPTSISHLMELEIFDISRNEIKGVIPAIMGSLSHLKRLDLSVNFLEGTIPRSFKSLSNLKYVNFSSNRLCGPIPPISDHNFPSSAFGKNKCSCKVPLPNCKD